MRVILTADIHAGYTGKLQDSIWAMEIMRRYAEENQISTVLVLGDLFHDRVSLNIEVVNAVYDQLNKCVESGQDWRVFCGNHDMFLKNSWQINSLHIFNRVITIYEDIQSFDLDGRTFWVLPFIHSEEEFMAELRRVEEKSKEGDVLLTHIGVHGATLNECFLLKHWGVVNFTDCKFDRVYTGHFHCMQQVGENVWYPGSPIPFRFDEGVVDHGFLVFDTETRQHEFVSIWSIYSKYTENRPADYITLPDDQILTNVEAIKKNHVRVLLTQEYTTNELVQLRDALVERGALSVKWMLPKKKVDAPEAEGISKPTPIGERSALFQAWVEKDEPELNRKLLFALDEQIASEAEERIVATTDDEDEV